MRIWIRVVPRVHRRSVEVSSDGSLIVRVAEPPEDGRANRAVLEAVAEYLGVPVRAVALVSGQRSRRKLLEVASRTWTR